MASVANTTPTPFRSIAAQNVAGLSIPFGLLLFDFFLLWVRPGDIIKPLAQVHMPLITLIFCAMLYLPRAMGLGRPLIPMTPVTKCVLLVTIWAGFTVPFAYWKTGALLVMWHSWGNSVVVFILLSNLADTVKRVKTAVVVSALGITAICGTSVLYDKLHGAGSFADRLAATVDGPYSGSNLFCMSALLFLSYAVFAVFFEKKFMVRLVAAGVAVTMLLATYMTQSRGGLISLAVMVMVGMWKLRRWGYRLTRMILLLLLGAVLTVAVAPKGLWLRFSTLIVSYDPNSLEDHSDIKTAIGSTNERMMIIKKSIAIAEENPIFGIGMGNFQSVSAHEFSSGSGRDWLKTHNSYLQFLTELGVPGLIMYLMVIYVALVTIRKTRTQLQPVVSSVKEARELAWMLDATSVAVWGYIVSSIFANTGYDSYFFILLGLLEAIYHQTSRLQFSPVTPEAKPEPAKPLFHWGPLPKTTGGTN